MPWGWMGWGEGARWFRAVELPRALAGVPLTGKCCALAGAPFAAVSGRLAIADSVPTRMRLRDEAVTPCAAARSSLKGTAAHRMDCSQWFYWASTERLSLGGRRSRAAAIAWRYCRISSSGARAESSPAAAASAGAAGAPACSPAHPSMWHTAIGESGERGCGERQCPMLAAKNPPRSVMA